MTNKRYIINKYTTCTRWPTKKEIKPEVLPYYHVRDELSLKVMCITHGMHVNHQFVIPATLQQSVLTTAHEGHLGIVRAKWQL